MTQIEANGITIDYEITGEGDPLLMIMGLGSQRISWPEGFVDEFTGRGYQVIQFDNRDAGLSTEFDGPAPYPAAVVMARLSGETPDVPYRLADMADDTAALLDGLGIGSTHVLGVSMGGMIAQELAIRHPQRVRSLTSIMSTTGDPSVGGVAPDLMGRLDELTATSIDHAVERSVAMWEAISGPLYDESVARARAERETERSFRPVGQGRQLGAIMAGPDRTPMLGKLDIPTVVIHGDADPLVLPDGGEATATAIAGAKLVTYPDMGHSLPEKYWSAIADELDALAGR